MNRIKFCLIALFLGSVMQIVAAEYSVKGCVVDENNAPIDYATVVMLKEGKQVNGTTTDVGGCFTNKVPAGNYVMTISYVGLSSHNDTIKVNKNIDLGKIILSKNAVVMKEVEVTASAIRRDADRFVMMVEDQPSAIGKDGEEVLKTAPGVWISDDQISINGKSGTKVYVNERELKLPKEQLIAYLKSLSAEDISKIEVVPITGAEYSADSQGGVIKITLKKMKDSGLMGSVALSSRFGKNGNSLAPRFNINYNTGKWSINAAARLYYGIDGKFESIEKTTYHNINQVLDASSMTKSDDHYNTFTLGAFYDFNPRHTIGAEIEYSDNKNNSFLTTQTAITGNITPLYTRGTYDKIANYNNLNAKFNYIWKIDTVGSLFKVLATYINNPPKSNSNNSMINETGNLRIDSIFREDVKSRYNVFNLGADLELVLNKKWKLKTGLKYSLNDMYNYAFYEYQKGSVWIPSTKYNYDIKYTENIPAIYAIANGSLGRWSLSAGLRGEYTYAYGEGDYVKQNYFDLFPNANLNYRITENGKYSINANYNRIISRPSFWELSPIRQQISDYSYQVGNPNLKPAYGNNYSLTTTMDYKYSLTLSISETHDIIRQKFVSDPDNPDNVYLTTGNEANSLMYIVSANAPITIAKWWEMSLNATYVYSGQKEQKSDKMDFYHMFFANMSTTITFPLNFYLTIDGYYQKQFQQGNMIIDSNYNFGVTVKKTFDNNKWVLSAGANQILRNNFSLTALSDSFIRKFTLKDNPSFRFSVAYNFNAGKLFRARTVESNEDASRLTKESK